MSAIKRNLDLEKQERVKARNQALVAYGGKFPAAKMDLAGFAEWSRSVLSIAGGCGLLLAFLTEEQLEAAGYIEGYDEERDGRLADARETLAEGLQEALQCPASEGRHFLTEQNRNDPAQIWEDIHAVKRKSGVGDARAIQACWLGLRMGEDELYASFIARVNAAARLCALCPSVGAPTNAMYLEVLRDGLCDRLRQFCRNILQRDAEIPFSELQEDLVQEERSYFSRRQGEYARLLTVPFVSPLISAAPAQMSPAKAQANVTDDGSRGNERACYNCGKVGHLVKNCPDTQREHGEKDQSKQEGTGNEKKRVCQNFQRNGTCSYGKGCKFKHTRTPGEGGRNPDVSNPVSSGSAVARGSTTAIGVAAPAVTKGARLSAEEAARQIQEIMARVQCNATTDVARPGTDLPLDWFADETCDAAFVLEHNGKSERADMSQGWDGFVDWFSDEAYVAVEVEGSEVTMVLNISKIFQVRLFANPILMIVFHFR
jgi:hypothetical protein